MLRAEGLALPHTALTHFNLEVAPGELVGLIGPSGSGKTSLARTLAGLTRPSAGRVLIDGQALTFQPRSRPTQVALIGQHPRAACNPRWTVRRIVSEPQLIAGEKATPESFCSRALVDEDWLSRRPGELSDGQVQRVCIARGLAQRSSYLLCDEPTAALDPQHRQAIVSLLRQLADEGLGVLLISHEQRMVAQVADRTISLG